ncbi:MAG: right-handed parallel beta-helix repeat-containing protein, partial [Firmicutes bacterium]|nr:right-handed parallel beta-helix repeat-containing protein [Bacillota bacterium]
AAGVRHLTITENRISDFSSPWNVGGIWLDPLAPDAQCEVTYNALFYNDNGIDVRGASGCLIAHNAILAGSTGIELGAQVTASGTPLPSSNNVIRANSIQGVTTVATTLATVNGTTTTPAVAQAPLDGILVWDGQDNQMTGNHITDFVTLVYIGEDPAYLNNSASWPSGAMPTYDNSGNALHENLLARLAAPAASSGISGWAVANLNNQVSFVVDATNNWWGSGNGPEVASNTFNVGAQGLPVTDGVLYTPWLLFAPPLDAAGLLGFSPVVNLSTGLGYPSIGAALSQSLSGAALGLASGVFSEAVTINQPGLSLSPLPGTERPTILGPGTAGAATVTIGASGVSLVGLVVQNPAAVGTAGQAILVQGSSGSPIADVTLEGLQVLGGETGILFGPYVDSATVSLCAVQHFWSVGISVGDYSLGGQATSATIADTVVSSPLPSSGGQSGIQVVNGATATLRNNLVA